VGIKLYYPGAKEIQHGGVRFVEHIHGSGYHLLEHSKSDTDFVDAERVSMCVTFACAMTRKETFEKLGGLEEVFFPNGFGDVDICLRALDAGYRHYYLGSLEGIHHESLSRAAVGEDLELTAVHERHARVIATWRHRHLNRAPRHAWPLLVPPQIDSPQTSAPIGAIDSPQTSATIGASAAFPVLHASRSLVAHSPFRRLLHYWLANKVVEALQYSLGPASIVVRSAVLKSVGLCRHLKSPAMLYSTLRSLIKPIPLLGPLSGGLVREARRLPAGRIPAPHWRIQREPKEKSSINLPGKHRDPIHN
jgi:hypothetical protein